MIKGQGLGNQLFVYVTARAIATEKGCEFGIYNPEQFGNNIHSSSGMYFMDIDCGIEITAVDKEKMNIWNDDDARIYLGTSKADMDNGIYVSGSDETIHAVEDNTLLYGNLQAESYFIKYKDRIKDWLKVKPEYDSKEYTKDNLCILNMRGGEYSSSPELFLGRKYWLCAMKQMRKIRPDMEFMIVTEDVESAKKILPEVEAHHFDMGKDYVTVKNARYLVASNSSFAVLAALTSDELKYAIAPKYWARHNVSNGYWASEQNIYSFFHYMDRRGKIFSADECRAELESYKKTSGIFESKAKKATGLTRKIQLIRSQYIYKTWMLKRAFRKIERKLQKY